MSQSKPVRTLALISGAALFFGMANGAAADDHVTTDNGGTANDNVTEEGNQHPAQTKIDITQDHINEFEASGELGTPLVNQLSNRLDQTQHHLSKGSVVQAMQMMENFLHHLHNNGMQRFISDDAKAQLDADANAVIAALDPSKPDTVPIVQDGEANAYVVSTPDMETHEVPGWDMWLHTEDWRRWYAAPIQRSEQVSYSGDSSLLMDGMTSGGVRQQISIEPGPVSAQFHYYTADGSPNAGEINIRLVMEDANGQALAPSLFSQRVSLSDTSGDWASLTLDGEIPETHAGAEVVGGQADVQAVGVEDTQVYIDDFVVYQNDNNLVENSGFESIDHPGGTLIDYVELSTGAELPFYVDDSERDDHDGVAIYVGHSPEEDHARHQDLLHDMNEDGFIIDVQDETVTILGKTDRATEYGVHEFLERYLDVRWLMPGPDGEHVPKHHTLEIPQELVEEEPASISRGLEGYYDEAFEFGTNNRMHLGIDFHHNLGNLFDPEIFSDRPEFYPDHEVPTETVSWNPAFNDETAEAAIARIIEYFDANPDVPSYSLGITDGRNWYEDEGHPNYPDEMNSIGHLHRSDYYYPWVNKVVEGVTEIYPDKWFGLLAYREMFDPPKNEDGTPYELHPNVVPYITDDRMSWIDSDVEQNAKDHIEAWQESATNLGWYEYMYGSQYNAPRVYPHVMADNYQYAQEKGVIAHWAEVYPTFAGEGPKPWISAKLQWDPSQDVDLLLEDWYTSAVGNEAAPYLQAHFEHWEDIWTERMLDADWFRSWADADARDNYLTFATVGYLGIITREDIEVSKQLLQQVVEHSGPGKQQARAEKFLQGFEFYETSALSYSDGSQVEPPANEEEASAMMDRIIESHEMAARRGELRAEFRPDPILRNYGRNIGSWSGVLNNHIRALLEYVADNPDSAVEDRLNDFIDEVGYVDARANAVRTRMTKEEIMNSHVFNQEPWTAAESFSNFHLMGTNSPPTEETHTHLLWDDEHLYVGYELFDENMSDMVISESTNTDASWWGDGLGTNDSMETYVTADPTAQFPGYFANPIGVNFTRYRSVPAPDVEFEVSAEIGTDSWTLIKAIPFEEIGLEPNVGDTIQGNFFRNFHGETEFIGWNGSEPWLLESFRPVTLVE